MYHVGQWQVPVCLIAYCLSPCTVSVMAHVMTEVRGDFSKTRGNGARTYTCLVGLTEIAGLDIDG